MDLDRTGIVPRVRALLVRGVIDLLRVVPRVRMDLGRTGIVPRVKALLVRGVIDLLRVAPQVRMDLGRTGIVPRVKALLVRGVIAPRVRVLAQEWEDRVLQDRVVRVVLAPAPVLEVALGPRHRRLKSQRK
jgi:hypothetical protein